MSEEECSLTRNSKCLGPEVGEFLTCMRIHKDTSVAGVNKEWNIDRR